MLIAVAMLALCLTQHVAARKTAFDLYSGGRVAWSCYTPEAACKRYNNYVHAGPNPSGLSHQCKDPSTGNGYTIWVDVDHCSVDGTQPALIEPDGCWTSTNGDCQGVNSNCSANQQFNGSTFQCADANDPNPNLGSDNCPKLSGPPEPVNMSKNKPMRPLLANPINAATGNKAERAVDIEGSARSLLRFERFYNSRNSGIVHGPVGRNWTHTFSTHLVVANAGGFDGAFVYRPDGSGHYFALVNGNYESHSAPTWTLSTSGSDWTLDLDGEGIETFDSAGRLITIDHPYKPDITLNYDNVGRLESVVEATGRQLTFESDWNFRVTAVTDPSGARWQYLYDSLSIDPSEEVVNLGWSNLTEVILPDATPGDDTDNPRVKYIYDDRDHLSGLTGIIDERGNRVSTWAYDDLGRAILSEHAAGTDNHMFTFNADGTTTVTDPQGAVRTYSFTKQNGMHQVASVTGGACSQCGGDAASHTYDANGFMESKTDFNGNVTTYQRDAVGRELSRTEAAGTPEARTITTAWDTTHNKPHTVTEPGRITTYSYDTDGRLLSTQIQSQP